MKKNNYDGTFITLEGLDGSGKSSLVEVLQETFGATTTSEPTDSWIGEVLRKSLRDDETPPLTDFFMFLADRAYHIEKTVEPALEAGEKVLCDRYVDSTTAYQTHILEEEFVTPEAFIAWSQDAFAIEPDLTLYIDIDVETAVRRSEGVDKYERGNTLTTVKNAYESRVCPLSRVVVIDGEQSFDDVLHDCIEAIHEYEED